MLICTDLTSHVDAWILLAPFDQILGKFHDTLMFLVCPYLYCCVFAGNVHRKAASTRQTQCEPVWLTDGRSSVKMGKHLLIHLDPWPPYILMLILGSLFGD